MNVSVPVAVVDPFAGTTVPAASVTERMTSRDIPEFFTVRIDRFGNYSPKRWAWLFRDVKLLMPPPPVVGHQRVFDLPQGWMTNGM